MAKNTDIPHYNPDVVKKIALKWAKEKSLPMMAITLAKLGLKDRGKLIRSLKAKVRKRFGDVESVRMEFLWYGLFHQVGAENVFGKGISLPSQNWLGEGINPNIESLANDLANYYGDITIKNIEFGKK